MGAASVVVLKVCRQHSAQVTLSRRRRDQDIRGESTDDALDRVVFRKKIYRSIDELQIDLDAWMIEYNEVRTHQGRYCFGKTPAQTFLDATPLAREKNLLDLATDHPSAA